MILMYTISLSSVIHLKLLTNTKYYIYLIKNCMIIQKNILTLSRVVLSVPIMNQMSQHAKKIITLSDLLSGLMMSMVMMDMILHLRYQTASIHLLNCTECLCTRCCDRVIALVCFNAPQDARTTQMY